MDVRTDLIPIDSPHITQLFDSAAAMGVVLKKIEAAALAETADPATEDGRASIRSLSYKIARSKTALDVVGKPLADRARVKYDEINSIRKTAKNTLDALRDKIRKPVTDWEDVEKQRVGALEDRLTAITALREYDRTVNPEVIENAIFSLENLGADEQWQEFAERATEEKATSLDYLIQVLAEAIVDEAKEAELAELRAEKLEREAQDQERAREAAIAEREKIAAENARSQATIDAEAALEREKERGQREFDRAQREVAEAKLLAEKATVAERERAEQFEADKRAARENRERDDENRAQVFAAVAHALESDPVRLSPHDAKKVVGATADKLIPHLTINF